MAPQSLTVCENDVEQDWRKLTNLHFQAQFLE